LQSTAKMIKKYKKRPVVIEAVVFEYTSECLLFLKNWLGDEMGTSGKARHPDALGWVQIRTLEDGQDSYQVKHIASEGDYIIRGVQGEFYAVKPDIFEETYQQVINPIVERDMDSDNNNGC
jgi:hypothetical protein